MSWTATGSAQACGREHRAGSCMFPVAAPGEPAVLSKEAPGAADLPLPVFLGRQWSSRRARGLLSPNVTPALWTPALHAFSHHLPLNAKVNLRAKQEFFC